MDETIGRIGLTFFGQMTASISHELKNRIAIINEQAGLLEDLVFMARKGKEIDSERLARLSESMKTQVGMADGILKTMNRFAHSVDVPWVSSDLGEILKLSGGLFRRAADMKGVRFEMGPEASPVSVRTFPFFLLNLIGLCLDTVMRASGKGRTVTIGCGKTAAGEAVITISTDGPLDAETFRIPPEGEDLASFLAAGITVHPDNQQVTILFQGSH